VEMTILKCLGAHRVRQEIGREDRGRANVPEVLTAGPVGPFLRRS
jgi:hypothetical protein